MGKVELDQIRHDMECNVGKAVVLTSKKGRKKTVIHQGIIESIYPSVFVVKLDSIGSIKGARVSYSYIDVLTKSVEVELYLPTEKIDA